MTVDSLASPIVLRSMNKQLLLAVIEMLKVTLGNMPAKEADKIVSAAIDILETQV